MTVDVLLFAQPRDALGSDRVQLDIKDGATYADLRAQFVSEFPQMQSMASLCRFAAGGTFVGEGELVSPGVEIAMIPPVSGG